MNRALRNRMSALCVSLCVISSSYTAYSKGDKEGTGLAANSNNNSLAGSSARNAVSPSRATEFEWSAHNKLSWEDFRGPANAESEEAAAATHCSIGLKLCKTDNNEQTKIVVYNNFYTGKSWVKPDAMIPEILTHEQGHFDLCEIYTRKLRQQVEGLDATNTDIRLQLQQIYAGVKNEYENRQQAYERETIHGTNIARQKKWSDMITAELN